MSLEQHLPTKAIIFDFDGTLAVLNIDFSSMRDRVFDLMKRLGIEEALVKERYLLEIIDEVSCILKAEKSPSTAEKFYQEAHQILHEVEMKAAEQGRLIPGAEETLKTLKGKGVKVGIVTRNCEDAVRRVFPAIDQFCDVFISRDSTKKVKPHPDHLTAVKNVLNVSGDEAIMVGDHPLDIQAGKKVGMKTIGVLTGRTVVDEFQKAGADYVLRGVPEICRLLDEPERI